jgi:hypothetical protein
MRLVEACNGAANVSVEVGTFIRALKQATRRAQP